MYKQGDMIRDFIFPIISFEILENGSVGYKQFFGTGFFLGNRGFALTAAHVANGFRNEKMAAMFVDVDLSWKLFPILGYELHPSEDIALLKIEGKNWLSLPYLLSGWDKPADMRLLDIHRMFCKMFQNRVEKAQHKDQI
jgi:S1-C subfamily serine protease